MADAVVCRLPAPAKLNLWLRIVGRREDGMHLLDGESALINLQDTIMLTPRDDGKIIRSWQHPQIGDDEDLCLRAARLLREKTGRRDGVSIRVEKKIPVGGGLGGASSNAASVIFGLNRLWKLQLPLNALMAIGAALGADVCFFLFGSAARIGGVGDVLSKIQTQQHSYLLVFPMAVALTAAVYAEHCRLTKTGKLGKIPFPLEKSKNDLTLPALRLYPSIIAAARTLRSVAPEARLSGSGSTVFAEFASAAAAKQAQDRLPVRTQSAVVSTMRRHPLA